MIRSTVTACQALQLSMYTLVKPREIYPQISTTVRQSVND